MNNQDDDFFNWSGAPVPDPPVTADYRRKLHIRYQPPTDNQPRGDPFTVLAGLRLLPEDRSYLHGFIGALKLPEHIQYGLLLEYRQRWEQAAKRVANPNQAAGRGRTTANIWIQQGAKGFVHWQ